MPKERSNRSASFEARSRASPFPCSSSSRHRGCSSSSSRNPPESRNPPPSPTAAAKDIKEWDEVRCPVCMEHPHNAVLLICTSSNKGCQPFMCDTSYRHSNCLDQYRKTFTGSSSQENEADQQPSKLSCPLCRGVVTGWKVVEPARKYMNSKLRSCSTETCGFTGVYGDLRKHARTDHPSVRPSEADPERQRDWRRMEQQRDIGDLVSTMQSAMGGEDGGLGAFIEDEDPTSVAYHSITVFFILRFRGPGGMGIGRTSGRVTSRSRRGRTTFHWGETLNEPDASVIGNSSGGDDGDDNDDDDVVDSGGSDEMPAASRQSQGRPRRQLRLSEEEEDANEDDDML